MSWHNLQAQVEQEFMEANTVGCSMLRIVLRDQMNSDRRLRWLARMYKAAREAIESDRERRRRIADAKRGRVLAKLAMERELERRQRCEKMKELQRLREWRSCVLARPSRPPPAPGETRREVVIPAHVAQWRAGR